MMKKKLKKTGRSLAMFRGRSERQPPHPKPLEERASRFTPEELEKLHQTLLEKRRELLDDVGSLHNEATCMNSSGESTGSSSMPIHMAELGSDTWEQELTYRLLENKEALLREIDDALQRIQNNTYGTCQASQKPIAKSRLRFIPWARYCIEYAWKGEIALA
jgi:RNA polymerase-binding transcription factor DksA